MPRGGQRGHGGQRERGGQRGLGGQRGRGSERAQGGHKVTGEYMDQNSDESESDGESQPIRAVKRNKNPEYERKWEDIDQGVGSKVPPKCV